MRNRPQFYALASPDLGAYAAGEIDAAAVRCALCEQAPCNCPEFGSAAYFELLDRRHGRNGSHQPAKEG
jgi:hypothetical protein